MLHREARCEHLHRFERSMDIDPALPERRSIRPLLSCLLYQETMALINRHAASSGVSDKMWPRLYEKDSLGLWAIWPKGRPANKDGWDSTRSLETGKQSRNAKSRGSSELIHVVNVDALTVDAACLLPFLLIQAHILVMSVVTSQTVAAARSAVCRCRWSCLRPLEAVPGSACESGQPAHP